MISVCIVCRNEADKLGPCLESVRWADEVVLLDLDSDDGSGELARAAGARVIGHPPVPIVEAVRNVVADAATGDWVLALDPDERVSPGLAAELGRASARADIDAVVVPRMNFDFGYPATSPLQRHEPQLRMYRRAAVRWPTFPNALPEVSEERVLRLPARDELTLVHDRNRNIPEAIDRVRRYAPAQAQADDRRGRGLHGSADAAHARGEAVPALRSRAGAARRCSRPPASGTAGRVSPLRLGGVLASVGGAASAGGRSAAARARQRARAATPVQGDAELPRWWRAR